ncbi:hypothetical protein HY029_01425 [Candidatus Gottesmanbacteria bacterium]|nr:hypothetical protein [Candidatus Gottesmanbacteria bacterium]
MKINFRLIFVFVALAAVTIPLMGVGGCGNNPDVIASATRAPTMTPKPGDWTVIQKSLPNDMTTQMQQLPPGEKKVVLKFKGFEIEAYKSVNGTIYFTVYNTGPDGKRGSYIVNSLGLNSEKQVSVFVGFSPLEPFPNTNGQVFLFARLRTESPNVYVDFTSNTVGAKLATFQGADASH